MLASPQLLESYHDMLDQVSDLAHDNQLKLDYTPASVQLVDQLLTKLHTDFEVSHDHSEEMLEALHGLALILGCYVIETVERLHGNGTWRLNPPEAGQPELPYDLPYTHTDQTIAPVEWCYTRLIHGGKPGSLTKAYGQFMDRLDEEARA